MAGWPNLCDLIVPAETEAPVGLLGVPLAAGSVTPGSCYEAPLKLRKALKRIGRYDVETGRELSTLLADRGDVEFCGPTIEKATPKIRDAVEASVTAHALTLLIGGNNAVTRPGVLGLGIPLDQVGLITLDAHLDLR